MGPTDGTLVLGVLNGDRSAFAELYDRRARLIRAVCYDACRDLHTAADLTQESFLRAFRNLGKLKDPDRFAAWLTGITRQVCREWRRRHLRDERRAATLAARQDRWTTRQEPPDPRLVALREIIAVPNERGNSAGDTLSSRERVALHAFYLQGCNVEEARVVLGLSRSGFYRVLSSAVKRLRRLMCVQEVRL